MCMKKGFVPACLYKQKPPKAHDSYSFTKFSREKKGKQRKRLSTKGFDSRRKELQFFFFFFLGLLSHKQLFWTPLSLGILCRTWDCYTWACMGLGGCRSAFPLTIEENVHFNWVPTESWWRLSQSRALTDGSLFLPSPAVTLGRTGRAAAV